MSVNSIENIFLNIIELDQVNRTIQSQSLDNTIKKVDVRIDEQDASSKKLTSSSSRFHCFSFHFDRKQRRSSKSNNFDFTSGE